MKHLTKRFIFAFLFLGFITAFNSSEKKSETSQWVIHVNSANPESTVSFNGAYLFFQEKELGEINMIDKETPFSVTETSDGFTGTFKSNSDDELFVALAKRTEDQEVIVAQGKGKEIKITEYNGQRIVEE